jgi:hypothetical protein
MAGLNDFLTGTSTSQTTMPSWYDQAQQNVVNQAQTQTAAMPQLQNTVAGQAINNLSGANNPFLQAQGQLSQIATGAANPWITDTTTGQVIPNTSTALGGLFQAQNQALNQVLPSTIAPAQAGAIGSGNFGSLRGQTAVDKAKADALANLQAQQMQAALTSQQTGVNAATGLSGVGAQGTTSMMQTGQAQQAAPLTATSDLAKILASVNAPASVTQSDVLSPLQQISALASAGGTGVTGINSILGSLFPAQGTPGTSGYVPATTLGSLLGKLFSTGSTNTNTGGGGTNTDTGGGGTVYTLADGSTTTDRDAYLADLQQQAADELNNSQNNSGNDYPTDSSGGLQFDDAAQGTSE